MFRHSGVKTTLCRPDFRPPNILLATGQDIFLFDFTRYLNAASVTFAIVGLLRRMAFQRPLRWFHRAYHRSITPKLWAAYLPVQRGSDPRNRWQVG